VCISTGKFGYPIGMAARTILAHCAALTPLRLCVRVQSMPLMLRSRRSVAGWKRTSSSLGRYVHSFTRWPYVCRHGVTHSRSPQIDRLIFCVKEPISEEVYEQLMDDYFPLP